MPEGPSAAPRPALLEILLAREQAAVLLALAAAIALSWAYLVPAAYDMYGAMDGLSAWMMAAIWDARYILLIFLMWAVMMVGMMLPSAAPAILLFARSIRGGTRAVARSYAFTGGYLLTWTGFSLAATLAQWALAEAALMSPMMETSSAAAGAILLIVAGVYQWTPLKDACLAHCRAPAEFISSHFRPGMTGALTLGAHHGLYCVGCCWALMLLLFVGGVMNLLWIAAITVFVLLEKLAPHGAQGGRLSGVLLVATGGWMLAA